MSAGQFSGGVAAFVFLLAAGMPAAGGEYFIDTRGNDTNDGLAVERAFLTVQRGLDALAPGDTLTIGPGEYFGSARRDNLGAENAQTVIRAAIPGTVLLRGDLPAPEFSRVEGYRFVYAAVFDHAVQAVNEADTLTILETLPAVTELEFTPGACHYDAERKRLYISTSDVRDPGEHRYTVSVVKNYGLFLHQPVRVTVEGIAATGFNSSAELASAPGDYSVAGIMLAGARRCVVRQCVAYLNANGIFVHSGRFSGYRNDPDGIPVYTGGGTITPGREPPGGNLVEECRAFGNYSRHSGSGGNIMVFDSDGDEIRDCEAYASATHGIRHYGAIRGPAVMSGNLGWGNYINDLHVKGGRAPEFGVARRCVTLGPFHVSHVSQSIMGAENRYNADPGADNIRYDLEAYADRDREFADPDNLDFRLQAGSKFRGAGPGGVDRGAFAYGKNIFYVRPGGDDLADGQSVAGAWRTLARALKVLRSGDTLYLSGGTYDAGPDLAAGRPGGETIRICGRGAETVVIRGGLRVTGASGVVFERLNFTGGVVVRSGRDIAFDNCRFAGGDAALRAEAVDNLRVTHGLFAGFGRAALDLVSCSGVFLAGNIFDNRAGAAVRTDQAGVMLYSDYNSYRDGARAWETAGAPVGLDALRERHERQGHVLAPVLRLVAGVPYLENPEQFSARGPNGSAIGIHNYRQSGTRTIHVLAPEVHSVTPTTANLEWRVSMPAGCRLAWGKTPDCPNRVHFNTEGFGSYSLTGLEPGTRYYFRVEPAGTLSGGYLAGEGAVTPGDAANTVAPAAPALVFETPREAAEPVVYHVGPDGDDGNSGLARETAFRTVSRAAERAGAGDTVLIAAGEYRETVRVRATGRPGRPVAFRSLPGERVVFDGSRIIDRAFIVSGKNHIQFDGLYFRNFSESSRPTGIFCLYRSEDIRITRCFMDGRVGYSPSFVNAYGCADLIVRNCAVISGFYGNLYLVRCPGALIENNVLLRSLIQECIFVNRPGEEVRLENNIITDNVPHKLRATLMEVALAETLTGGNNCYYLRIPQEERKMFMFYNREAWERAAGSYDLGPVDESRLSPTLDLVSLGDFQGKHGNAGSIARNPWFRATVGMPEKDEAGNPVFLVDRLLGVKGLDFPDLFATDPEVVRLGIGLVPADFAGFSFDR